jgi:hypothetical protein
VVTLSRLRSLDRRWAILIHKGCRAAKTPANKLRVYPLSISAISRKAIDFHGKNRLKTAIKQSYITKWQKLPISA